MHQETYDGQPASYPQYNTAPEVAGHCATQSATGSFDSIREELSNISSPASQATNPSELLLTPNSDLDLAQFPLGIDYSPYLCQQQQESTPAASAFEDAFITPDLGFPFQLGEADSPNSATSSNWHSTGHQQFTWDPSSNPEMHNMMTGNVQLSDQFPRQMPDEVYGSSRFGFEHGMVPVSPGDSNSAASISSSSESSSSLPVHEESTQMNINVDNLPRFNNGAMHSLPAPAEKPEGTGKAKPEEPYAKLIQRALMSADDHKMALQQIYQWFRENTDKTNSDGKGWMNSIRHNLSMNAAFEKCERGSTGDAKKSTVWQLAEFAVRDGVQSTTRYRKGNPARRSGSAAHNRSHGSTTGRASSVRGGGVNTSKNRSVDVRRSVLTRATNSDLLHRHLNPAIGPANNQLLSYNYLPNSYPAMNHLNWMGHPNHAALPPTPSNEFATYTYNHSSHNEAMGGFSQGEHSQPLYPAPEIAGAYGGSPLPANTHVHNQHLAMPASYDAIVSNPQESVDRDYFTWNPTPSGGSYA
ncbi:hypothetical protein F4801DRAFT_581327 [Xylaria longipes]|nr:hypothetical protein F4801DRAFT_581327 [Xylaria longipes]